MNSQNPGLLIYGSSQQNKLIQSCLNPVQHWDVEQADVYNPQTMLLEKRHALQ
jgi:hypothetical protein